MAEPGDVTVINTLSIQGGASLPIIRSVDQEGGWRQAADDAARDAIPASFRAEGMYVYVIATDMTYRLGAGLGNGDWTLASGGSGGGITGDHPILGNPSTTTELADFLDSNYRPVIPTATSSYTVYVTLAGNDTTGDGSIGAPYATIQRATQAVAALNSGASTATVSLGAGSFDLPGVMEANFTNFQGTTSVEDVLTVDAVIVSDNSDAIVIDVTSTGGPYAADELRSRLQIWTSGTSSGNEGWTYRNDVTAVGITRIYATHDSGPSTGIEAMSPGDTINLIALETSVRVIGFAVFQNSVQFNWRDIRFYATSDATLLCLSTDKVDFDRCFFDGAGGFLRRLQSGGFGRAFLTNCYYATAGISTQAFLALKNNGFLQIQRGTVLDADLYASAPARWVEGSAGSLLAFQKNVVLRGFTEPNIFYVDGLGIFAIAGIGTDDCILVEDANGTSTYQAGPVFKVNSTGAGQGGWYQLPNLHGSITGDYSVEAQNCACTIVGDGTSTIGTNLGTNTVSADSGVSNVAVGSDLTLIEGASPAFPGFTARYTASFVDGDLTGGVLTVNHFLGSQFVNVTVYDDSNVSVAFDSVTATNSVGCDIDLSSQGVLAGTWNVVVSG